MESTRGSSAFDLVSVTVVTPAGASEMSAHAQRMLECRDAPLPLGHVVVRPRPLVSFFEGLKPTVRAFVKTLYLFPVLLVAKLVLWLLDQPAGDFISVLFVILVVLTFLLLSILVVLYPFVGPPSKRHLGGTLALALPEAKAAESALERLAAIAALGPAVAGQGTPSVPAEPMGEDVLRRLCEGGGPEGGLVLRVRGRVSTGIDGVSGETVLRDTWADAGGRVARLAAGRTFAVVGDSGPKVVVDLEAAPWVIGEYEPADKLDAGPEPAAPSEMEAWLADGTGGAVDLARMRHGQTCLVRHGNEVEVIGSAWDVAPSQAVLSLRGGAIQLAASTAPEDPYRRAHVDPVLVLRSTPSARAIVRKIER